MRDRISPLEHPLLKERQTIRDAGDAKQRVRSFLIAGLPKEESHGFSFLQKLPIRLLAVEQAGSQKQGGTSAQIYAVQINVDRWSSYELSPIDLGAELSSRSG
jgi:hypothetical protein